MKLLPLLLLLIAPLTNYACKCRERSIAESVKDAEVVVSGKIISRTEVTSNDSLNPYHLYRYQLKVSKTYKGKPGGRTITVYSGMGGGDCGYGFVTGKSYVVYGNSSAVPDKLQAGGGYSTNMCAGTHPYESAYINDLKKVVGKTKK